MSKIDDIWSAAFGCPPVTAEERALFQFAKAGAELAAAAEDAAAPPTKAGVYRVRIASQWVQAEWDGDFLHVLGTAPQERMEADRVTQWSAWLGPLGSPQVHPPAPDVHDFFRTCAQRLIRMESEAGGKLGVGRRSLTWIDSVPVGPKAQEG